jgi:hypothetical protein
MRNEYNCGWVVVVLLFLLCVGIASLSIVRGQNVTSSSRSNFRCTVTVSTATTIQAVGSSCVAPGAGLSIYLTGIQFSTSAASATAADTMPTLKYGTGGTCGTGTTVFWLGLTTANSTLINNLITPIKIPANNEVCWIMTTAGTKALVLTGYIAP